MAFIIAILRNLEIVLEQLFMIKGNGRSLNILCATTLCEFLLKQRNINKTQSEFFAGILCINLGHFDLSWNQCSIRCWQNQ